MTTTRRDFLRNSAALLGAVTVGTALTNAGCVVSTAPMMKAEVTGPVLNFDTAIPELSKAGDGVTLTSEQLDYAILLIKQRDGSFTALSTECTHLGCSVKKQRTVLRCPCHGSVYDFQGNVMNGPAEKPLHGYEVRLSGTLAEIQLQS